MCIRDSTYSITVKGSYEPFFYNYAYLRTNPYPISCLLYTSRCV